MTTAWPDPEGPATGRRGPGRRRVLLAVAVVVVLVVAIVAVFAVRGTGDGPPPPVTSPSRTNSSSGTSSGSSSGSSSGGAAEVFGPAPSAAAGLPPDTSTGSALRSRYVSFRSQVLPTTADGRSLSLAFFGDATFVGTVEHVDRQALFTSWSGPLDLPQSIFVITRTGDRYQVTASTTRGSFAMNLTPAGLYQVVEADQPGVLDSGGATPLPG